MLAFIVIFSVAILVIIGRVIYIYVLKLRPPPPNQEASRGGAAGRATLADVRRAFDVVSKPIPDAAAVSTTEVDTSRTRAEVQPPVPAGSTPAAPVDVPEGLTSSLGGPAGVELAAITVVAPDPSVLSVPSVSAAPSEAALAAAKAAAVLELAGERAVVSAELAAAEALRAESAARLQQLTAREVRLDDRETRLEVQAARVAQREEGAVATQADLDARAAEIAALGEQRASELERISQLSAAEAKAELVHSIEAAAKREAAVIVRELEAEARTEGEGRARAIVTLAIQRVASEQTTESVVSVLHLPTDDMKGRIIGREGRNIRSFEAVTGVNVIIDDTPEAVLLSCFDPVRREVGRLTLEALVLDGRIHPQRIEETYEKAKLEVEALCRRAGEDALVEVGITEIDDILIDHLGRLRYRTSYGQNVLKHLLETAHIAGTMAAELRLDVALVKRCAFLHDIGKALTHEVEGSHAIIGADLARRLGESEEVVHAIEAHHNEVAPQTPEAVLTQASDSCSGGRPGARRESVESYVKRLTRIEEIAASRPGVERVFAMQAGREIRVMVQPDTVDDIGAQVIAREVATQIEDELTYPGQIRVTVVRESRASEVAR